jgi:hypothetical protein
VTFHACSPASSPSLSLSLLSTDLSLVDFLCFLLFLFLFLFFFFFFCFQEPLDITKSKILSPLASICRSLHEPLHKAVGTWLKYFLLAPRLRSRSLGRFSPFDLIKNVRRTAQVAKRRKSLRVAANAGVSFVNWSQD